MNIFRRHLYPFDWDIKVIRLDDYDDTTEVFLSLQDLHSTQQDINIAREILSKHSFNSAFTYTSKEDRVSLLVLSKVTSVMEIINSLMHELLHLNYHITSAMNYHCNNETMCTELGNLAEDIVRFLILEEVNK